MKEYISVKKAYAAGFSDAMRKLAQMPTPANNSMKHPAGGMKPSAQAPEGGTLPPISLQIRPPAKSVAATKPVAPFKPGTQLKAAYDAGFGATIEKLAARSLFPSGDPAYPMFEGRTSTQHFYDTLDKNNSGMRITPGQVADSSYPEGYFHGRVLPGAAKYRIDNPGKSWLQGIGPELDKPVFVRPNPNRDESGVYNPITNTAFLDTDPRLGLQARNEVTGHEIAGHAAQGRNALSANYIPGLVPSPAEIRAYKMSFIPGRKPVTNAAYYLNPVETEAYVRGLQVRNRNSQFALERMGVPSYNAEDPFTARVLLEKELRTANPDTSPLGGLIDTFKGLKPEQQELFLDHWSGQMPGLVQNRRGDNVPRSPTTKATETRRHAHIK